MGTKRTIYSGAFTLVLDFNEQYSGNEISFAPTITASSSGSYGDNYIGTEWDLYIDGVNTESGTGSTSYYYGSMGTGPQQIDSFNRTASRYVTRDYGTTHTFRIREKFTDFYGASGKTAIIDETFVIPALPYSLPAAPSSLSATRVNDSRNTLSWTNNATLSAPYSAIQIERSANGGAFEQIASISGSSTAYSDTSTAQDKYYSYRVRATNDAGAGDYSSSTAALYNTPAAPGTPTAVKVGASSVQLTFSNGSAIASGLEVEVSTNGGSTWSSAGSAVGKLTSWTDTSAPTATSIIYRARNTAGGIKSAWSAASNSVAGLAQPNPATITLAANTAVATGDAIRLTWQFNSTDGSAQSKYQIQTSLDNGVTWTTLAAVNSSDNFCDLSTAGFSDGDVVTWRVNTWGLYATAAGYSSASTFRVIDAPVVALVSPASDPYTLTSLPLEIEWTYSDTYSQAAARARVYDGSVVVFDTGALQTDGTSIVLDGWQPENIHSYRLVLDVRSSSTLVETIECIVNVNYTAPAIPSCSIVEGDGKSLQITVHEGTASGGEVATDSLSLYRVYNGTAELLADGLSDGETVTDYVPPMDVEIVYRVMALSTLNLTSRYDALYVLASHGWLVWNYGANNGIFAAVKYNATENSDFTDDSVLFTPAGSRDPISLTGAAAGLSINASGTVLAADLPAVIAFAESWKMPCIYRSPGGFKELVKASCSVKRNHTKLASVSVSMTRVSS